MIDPLFRKVDCVRLTTPDLDAALGFYRDALGHALIWRTPEAAGLAMPDTDADLVLQRTLAPATDLLVASVDAALPRFVASGGAVVSRPLRHRNRPLRRRARPRRQHAGHARPDARRA